MLTTVNETKTLKALERLAVSPERLAYKPVGMITRGGSSNVFEATLSTPGTTDTQRVAVKHVRYEADRDKMLRSVAVSNLSRIPSESPSMPSSC